MLTGEISAAVPMANPGSSKEEEEEEEEKGPVGGERRKRWVALANGCLLVMGAAGGALLAWWALSFHRSNEQLWMVPVGLVLAGTPVIAWISVFASAACRNRQPPLPPSNSDPER